MDLGKELNVSIGAKTIDLASCAEYVSWKLFENCSGQTLLLLRHMLIIFPWSLWQAILHAMSDVCVTEPNICGK